MAVSRDDEPVVSIEANSNPLVPSSSLCRDELLCRVRSSVAAQTHMHALPDALGASATAARHAR